MIILPRYKEKSWSVLYRYCHIRFHCIWWCPIFFDNQVLLQHHHSPVEKSIGVPSKRQDISGRPTNYTCMTFNLRKVKLFYIQDIPVYVYYFWSLKVIDYARIRNQNFILEKKKIISAPNFELSDHVVFQFEWVSLYATLNKSFTYEMDLKNTLTNIFIINAHIGFIEILHLLTFIISHVSLTVSCRHSGLQDKCTNRNSSANNN